MWRATLSITRTCLLNALSLLLIDVYRLKPKAVEIVTVFHSARLLRLE